MDNGQWTNFVDYNCAYNLHFTNWFRNRIASGTIGGVAGNFEPVKKSQLTALRAVYQAGECCSKLSCNNTQRVFGNYWRLAVLSPPALLGPEIVFMHRQILSVWVLVAVSYRMHAAGPAVAAMRPCVRNVCG